VWGHAEADGPAPGGDGEAGPERVATGELRAATGDVVTLALDEVDAEAIDPRERYRLVTLPSEPRADREFASLLRRADETMGVVGLPAGSPLVGSTTGDLAVSVVAIRPDGGTVVAIPRRDRTLAAGDTVYAIARPEALRRLEASAAPPEPEVAGADGAGAGDVGDADRDPESPQSEPS
jgi:hypothetical protein